MDKGESTVRLYLKEIADNKMLKKQREGRRVSYALDLQVVNEYLDK